MSSLFDSEVYTERNWVPGISINLGKLVSELIFAAPVFDAQGRERPGTVKLEVDYRHSVASRLWWTFSWLGADGKSHEVSAQRLDLCLWRAAVRERVIRQRLKFEEEKASVSEGKVTFSPANPDYQI